jgi:hypothetical protein
MTRASLPDGHDAPEQGRQAATHGVGDDAQGLHTEAADIMHDLEPPTEAAVLQFALFPVSGIGPGWAAMIEAARPLVSLALMGVLAPAATIYCAKAAKYPPALTAATVSLELALAYVAARAAYGPARLRAARQPLG